MKRYTKPELWGGVECSHWRLNDSYLNQLDIGGREKSSLQDLEKFAELGIRKLRYPVLMESFVSDSGTQWAATKSALNKLHSLGISPIIEFLHHGCGPMDCTFLDKNFPARIQRFASEVALRFPWVKYYCPINEPLTTARFSGLYGIWYPHHRDQKTFARIFIAQVLGTVLSIKAIREINPEAKFIQIEDLCKIYSTPRLQYQADFENERRWLTFDLLTSKVLPGHPMWAYLTWCGIKEKELYLIAEEASAPDVLGLNHYVTSERFLDHRLDDYPEVLKGGNGTHEYVDLEAVRVPLDEPAGLEVLLKECWNRYSMPIALTEIHLCGANDDQIRWFHEAWKVALKLLAEGIPITGVCAWALTGSYGWDKLLTQIPGKFEQGVFNIHNGQLVDSSYSLFIKDLVAKGESTHPSLNQKGWWHSEERFLKKLQCA